MNNTPAYFINAFLEPPEFTNLFHGWDSSMTTYPVENIPLVSDVYKHYHREYTLDELRAKPRGLDSSKMEQYLSQRDFFTAFQMTKGEFGNLPLWKQEEKKQKLGLY